MSTRSIYHKACPSCATLVSTDTQRCECGYDFDTQVRDKEPAIDEQTAHEQELFREYLKARVAQALANLQTAQAALVNDPKNVETANRLMQAFSEMRELRAEMETQSPIATTTGKDAGEEPGTDIDVSHATTATPAASAHPTEEFRAAQVAKIENIMRAAGIDTKACPKCSAVIPQRAALCFCGYAFARNQAEVPSATLAISAMPSQPETT